MYQKRNFAVMPRQFGGFFEDVLHNGWSRMQDEATSMSVPVNIHETDKSYELQLIAPGMKKEDFKISLDKNVLNISYEHKEDASEQKEGKILRTEYSIKSFKRSFTLNEKIDAANITAKYADGILHVSMAKKENVDQPAHEITIN